MRFATFRHARRALLLAAAAAAFGASAQTWPDRDRAEILQRVVADVPEHRRVGRQELPKPIVERLQQASAQVLGADIDRWVRVIGEATIPSE